MMAHIKVRLLLVISFVIATHAGIITLSDESFDQQFLSTLQYYCRRKTGNDDTFNRIKNYIKKISMCLKNNLFSVSSKRDTLNLTKSNRVKFFSVFCAHIRGERSCYNLVLPEIRKCLNQDVVEFWDASESAAEEAFNIACKDHGEIFFDSDGKLLKCLENRIQRQLDSCSSKVSYLAPVAKKCNDLVEVRNCYHSKLSQCNDDPRLTELVDIYFRPIVKDPCRKYISMDGNTTSVIEAK